MFELTLMRMHACVYGRVFQSVKYIGGSSDVSNISLNHDEIKILGIVFVLKIEVILSTLSINFVSHTRETSTTNTWTILKFSYGFCSAQHIRI
jgi:hypothetical protein